MAKVLDLNPLLKKKKAADEAAKTQEALLKAQHARAKLLYGKGPKMYPGGDGSLISTAQKNSQPNPPPVTTTIVIEDPNQPTKPKGST